MKRLFYLFPAVLAFFMVGCQREVSIPDERPVVVSSVVPASALAHVPVSVSSGLEGEETKSIISVESAETFHEGLFFCMNKSDGKIYTVSGKEKPGIYAVTEEKSFDWALPYGMEGSAYKYPLAIYGIANYGQRDFSEVIQKAEAGTLTIADLEALNFTCNSQEEFLLFEDQGIPLAGMTETGLQTETSAVTLRMKKLYAKYDISLNVSDLLDEYNVTGLYIYACKSNTSVPYFAENYGVPHDEDGLAQLKEMDFGSKEDLINFNKFSKEHKVSLYFLENCQGEFANDKWYNARKNIANYPYMSYIDFGIKATIKTSGEFINRDFQLFLGSGSGACVTNFDLKRNVYKQISIRITKPMIEDPGVTVISGIKFQKEEVILAPGEATEVYFEADSDVPDTGFEIELFEKDSETPVSNVISYYGPNLYDKNDWEGLPSLFNDLSKIGYFGLIVSTGAVDGKDYVLRLKNGEKRDELTLRVNYAASKVAGIKVVHMPKYAHEWMVIELPDSYIGLDPSNETGVYFRGTFDVNTGERIGTSQDCGIDIYDGSGNRFSRAENQRANIYKSHVNFDDEHNWLFVYPYGCWDGKNGKIELTIWNDEYGESVLISEYTIDIPELLVPIAHPCSDTIEKVSENEYNIRVNFLYEKAFNVETGQYVYTYKGTTGRNSAFSFGLFDPVTDKCIDLDRFWWCAVYPDFEMSGINWSDPRKTSGVSSFNVDNLLNQMSMIWSDTTDTEIEERFTVLEDMTPDPGCSNIYWEDVDVKFRDYKYSGEQYSFNNPSNWSFVFENMLFPGTTHIIPTVEVDDAGTISKNIRVYNAQEGENAYAKMKKGNTTLEDRFYLMYGFKKTIFVDLVDFPYYNTPDISVDNDYLKYSVSRFGDSSSSVYRVDFWVDEYLDPLAYDDTSYPHTPWSDWVDPSYGNQFINITIEYLGFEKEYECVVLNQRSNVGFMMDSNGFLVPVAFNPLGFDYSVYTCLTVNYDKYESCHPLTWGTDENNKHSIYTQTRGGYVEINQRSFNLKDLVNTCKNDKGVRCGYLSNYDTNIGLPDTNSDDGLILWYPNSKVTGGIFASPTLRMNDFKTTVPGLSLNGITWNSVSINNYATYAHDGLNFGKTTHYTNSEFYLQRWSILHSSWDLEYYCYKFQTPNHWNIDRIAEGIDTTMYFPEINSFRQVEGPDYEYSIYFEGPKAYWDGSKYVYNDGFNQDPRITGYPSSTTWTVE